MTNREKFGNTLLDIVLNIVGNRFAIKNGRPCLCDGNINCSECDLKEGECVKNFMKWLDLEYEPKIDWSKVPIDTKILVRSRKEDRWERRYFSGLNENKNVTAWINGNTSWSCSLDAPNVYNKIDWRYAKLATEEDMDKYCE